MTVTVMMTVMMKWILVLHERVKLSQNFKNVPWKKL